MGVRISLRNSVLITIFGLLVYFLGFKFYLPILDFNSTNLITSLPVFSSNNFGFFYFGMKALLSGFFIIEIMSFFVPPFKKWRKEGFEGRSKLNKSAFILSLLIGVMQSYQLISFFVASVDNTGDPLISDFTFLKKCLLMLFYASGITVVYFLGRFMSRKGLANGFSIFLLYGIFISLLQKANSFVSELQDPEIKPNYAGLVFLIIFLTFIIKILKNPKGSKVRYNGSDLLFEFPPLAQGVFYLTTFTSLLMLPATIGQFTDYNLSEFLFKNNWSYVVAFLLLTPVLAYFSYYIAYSPKRIKNNLGKSLSLDDNFTSKISSNLITKIISLTFVGAFLYMPNPLSRGALFIPNIVTLGEFLLVYFICKDIICNFKFISSVEKWVSLGEFDNVHLMTVVKGVLERENIPHHIKGFELRRLYSFMNSLFKMRLLVRESDMEKSLSILNLNSEKIV